MFQNLRKKVNSVLPDIENIYIPSATTLSNTSSPIKTINHFGLSNAASKSNDHHNNKIPIIQWPNSSAINFNAGCTLLEQNEKLWEELHATNERNGKKADDCDKIITNISESIRKRCIDISDINISLELVPNIVQVIENCSSILDDIHEKCSDVEEQLYELEDLIELLQLQEKQLDSKFEMAMFKERKLGKLINIQLYTTHISQ